MVVARHCFLEHVGYTDIFHTNADVATPTPTIYALYMLPSHADTLPLQFIHRLEGVRGDVN